jgi:nucleoside-diphosphate-sugar epimerase
MEVWRASQEGLDTLIVNPGVVLGAGFFESGSGQIFKNVLNNFKFYPPKKSGFVLVDDVIQAMLNGMQKDIVNQRYIIIGQNLSFKKVMSIIAQVFNRKKPTVKANKFMLYVVWVLQSLISIFIPLKTRITRNMIKTIFLQSEYDNSKSIQDLKINYTPIEESILKVYHDYKLLNPNT